MKCSKINKEIIKYLQDLADDNSIVVSQHKHIKIEGVYAGKKRSLTLAVSPSSLYQRYVRSSLRRFIKSLEIENPPDIPI